MRRVTRNFVLGILLVVALLLALGALPSYLKSGDPYYLTATPVAENRTAIDSADLAPDRYPYTTGALANASANETGQSDPYWKGPIGIKGAFTHSPFDERDALTQRNTSAVDGDTVYVRQNNTVYRLDITQQP
ncbi:hypothetical protein ACFR9U_13025 [Halorientalis brevis]|uniref:Uncharacterized protein n=1 Tax=Halorientalis brevis TaxID=1126241 RepID=A0ABD6CD31_9EURY|nr:hypothetical protein [Halorientalis brevis]